MIHLKELSGDEKILQSRFQDAIYLAQVRNQPKFTGFLDIRQQEILKAVSAAAGFSSWRLYGGFPEAERKVAGFFPDYVEPDGLDMFPIMPLTAHFREQDKLSHRDFLGSLMGLRISRELVGDILVGTGMAVFFVLEKAAPVLLDEFLKVGRVGITLSKGAQNLEELRPKLVCVSGTVSSARLDAVVAFLTHLSRGNAQEMIRQERVKVDGQVRTDIAGQVQVPSLLSIRGYGKYALHSFYGVSKKGRLHIKAGHYQ